MRNLSAKIKLIEDKLKKRSAIDPEYAIKQIMHFIDVWCYEGDVPDEEKIRLHDFIYVGNCELALFEGREKEERKQMWIEMEKGIQERNGFKADENDSLAQKIREF